MSRSILDAIKEGEWLYDPGEEFESDQVPTRSMPGTDAKVEVLAERARLGLPLWHPADRQSYDDDPRGT